MGKVISFSDRQKVKFHSSYRAGSIFGQRTMQPLPGSSRRRCSHCKQRATHMGMGDGVALTSGCEFYVRLWCKDPIRALGLKHVTVGPAKKKEAGR